MSGSTTVNTGSSSSPSFQTLADGENEKAAKNFADAIRFGDNSINPDPGIVKTANYLGNHDIAEAAINQGSSIAEQYGKDGADFEAHCHDTAEGLRERANTETGGQKVADEKEADALDTFSKDPTKYAAPGGVEALVKDSGLEDSESINPDAAPNDAPDAAATSMMTGNTLNADAFQLLQERVQGMTSNVST